MQHPIDQHKEVVKTPLFQGRSNGVVAIARTQVLVPHVRVRDGLALGRRIGVESDDAVRRVGIDALELQHDWRSQNLNATSMLT